MKFLLSAILWASLLTSPVLAMKSKSAMPIEAFSALPNYKNAKLSPSGHAIAYQTNFKGKTAVIVNYLNGDKGTMIPPGSNAALRNFYWANDDVVLLTAGALITRQAFSGKSYNTRVLAFNLKTKKIKWLGDPKGTGLTNKRTSQNTSQLERIVDMLPNDPKHILMAMDFSLDSYPEVYKVNVFKGGRKLIRRQKKGVHYWYTDHTSEIRMGAGYDRDGWYAMFRKPEGGWESLANVEWAKKYDIEGFSADPNILYVSGRSEHGTTGLFNLNIQTGEILEQVFAHPTVDIDAVAEHPQTGHLSGVTYTDDFYRVKYFDKDLAKIQRSIDRVLKGTVNRIVSRAKDRELYLLFVEDDKNPGDFYLFDRSKGQLHFISPMRERLDIERTAATTALAIPMRDGSSIPAYLSTPQGLEPKKLPTIILPHGGPHSRDSAEWDFWAQFYANRGYMVLKPNFRGSTGYGANFRYQGQHQWGGLMQDDVTDATRWLIKEGMADPDRICIVGASYGGYAALMGTIKEPGLYKCAISVNGVTDLGYLKGNDENFVGGNTWTKTMGLKGAKDETVSPYDRINDISAPVLLMASKDDERVPYRMAKLMHKRMKKLKKKSTYVEIPNGGHSMLTAESRQKMLEETEKFLAKYIGD